MSSSEPALTGRQNALHVLTHRNVLAGLMFVGVALFGLWLSRDYPVGTVLRMGTGYVPRLLCWVLLGLGLLILVQGFFEARQESRRVSDPSFWRPLLVVPLSLVLFGMALERLGLVVAILLLIGVGALASRDLRWIETAIAAVVLIVLSWVIFIVGLGLVIPVWPEW
jgi:hypothetical protein